jgi:hypothetical protein
MMQGRARSGGLQCWVALTTEAFAAELVGADASGKLPAQDAAYLAERAKRMLEATRKELEMAGECVGAPECWRKEVVEWVLVWECLCWGSLLCPS